MNGFGEALISTREQQYMMKRKIKITLCSLIVMTAFWFLAVDCSRFIEKCPDCMFGRDIIRLRVFTIPVYQQIKNQDTLLSKVATDAGVACTHPELTRRQKSRYWGLLICASCKNGTYWLSGGDEWYDEKASLIVKEMVKTRPALREDISNRVIKQHDWVYWHNFISQVESSREGKAVDTK